MLNTYSMKWHSQSQYNVKIAQHKNKAIHLRETENSHLHRDNIKRTQPKKCLYVQCLPCVSYCMVRYLERGLLCEKQNQHLIPEKSNNVWDTYYLTIPGYTSICVQFWTWYGFMTLAKDYCNRLLLCNAWYWMKK